MLKTVKIYKEDATIWIVTRNTEFGVQSFLKGHVMKRPLEVKEIIAIRNLTLNRQSIY